VSFNQSSGQYGFLTLTDSSGSYIYTLFKSTDNASLPPEGVGFDSFTYTYANETGLTDTAQLIISVNADPSQSRTPIANDDHESVIIALATTASGNVIDNDRYGTIAIFNEPTVGKYGFLSSTNSSGVYTYQLFNSTNNNDLPLEGVATENFSYTLENEDGDTDNAQLIINVSANPDQPIANDDYISTIVGVYTSATGNVGSNDRYGSIFNLNGSWVGKYGLITSFDSAGEYTYELFEGTDGASLPAGGVGIDNFTYTYANDKGLTDTAQLIIDVNANSTRPIAIDDYESAVIDDKPSAVGNVSTNDFYGDIVSFNQSSGQYGFLTLTDSSGGYIYTLFKSTDSSSLPASGIGFDTFTYTYANTQGTSDTAQLIIKVSSTTASKPIANDDYTSAVIADKPSATGNVSNNDLYGNVVTFNQSSGQYGFLTLPDSSGSYTYTLFSSTDNASLPPSGVGIDSFTYTYANETGLTDTAQLIINVYTGPTSSSGGSNTPIARDDNATAIPNEQG